MTTVLSPADVLKYVAENTYRPNMEDVSTKQIAQHFGVPTSAIYKICDKLAADKLITKLEPTNGDKFSCCGWINNK